MFADHNIYDRSALYIVIISRFAKKSNYKMVAFSKNIEYNIIVSEDTSILRERRNEK